MLIIGIVLMFGCGLWAHSFGIDESRAPFKNLYERCYKTFISLFAAFLYMCAWCGLFMILFQLYLWVF